MDTRVENTVSIDEEISPSTTECVIEENETCTTSGSMSEFSPDTNTQLINSKESSLETSTNVSSKNGTSVYNTPRRSSFSSESDYGIRNLFSGSSASSRRRTPQQSEPINTLLDGLDVLLQRITRERFLELRELQLADRPVTGSGARDNLENFFHRAIHGPSNEERINEEEANRPGHVAEDVQSLLQQNLVQTTLQNGFRDHLERTLSGRFQAPRLVRQPRRRVGSSALRSQLESLYSGRGTQQSTTQPSRRTQQNTHTSRRTQPHRNNQFAHAPVATGTIPPPPPPPPQHQVPTTQRIETENPTNLEHELQRLTETISHDLTRLQHLQVVSNMLEGGFRNTLETLIEERVQSVGNGEAVERFVRQIPRQTAPTQQRATPRDDYRTDNEISSLRTEVIELKQMLAMSMEVQMDTQRAIRQEVAAVFAAFMQQMATSGVPTTQPTSFEFPRSPRVECGQCVICVDKSVDSVLYQCGHMCVCHACGLQLKIDGHCCPMCRAPIRDVIRAYQTQQQ